MKSPSILLLTLSSLLSFTCTSAALPYTKEALADEIINLPGLKTPPPSDTHRSFSGYLPVSSTKNIFYIYVESKASTQASDPLVLWTNGGPGCSGLLGLFTENGPWVPQEDGSVEENPYSWNAHANMLFVEQPAGVGFSYSDDPEGSKDYSTGDHQAAVDNRELILQFLERFPQVKENDFYLTSESYGGHYLPTLAKEIVDNNGDSAINFKGFAVGNPYTNGFTNNVAQFRALYSHGVVPPPIFKEWDAECTQAPVNATRCGALEGGMMRRMGSGINPYAIGYPVCTDGAPEARSEDLRLMHMIHPEEVTKHLIPTATYEPCAEQWLVKYLNSAETKKALHADPKGDIVWGGCSNLVEYDETCFQVDTSPIYPELLKGGHGLNIMVYSGDDDAICAKSGTDAWIWDLGFEVDTSDDSGDYWKEFVVNKQTAGYVTKFDLGKANGDSKFTYATVHGAGHQVPTYKPEAGLALFKGFLEGGL